MSKFIKGLRYVNVIPIVTANDNTILNNHVYEVDYLDVHKAELKYNTATENNFVQVIDKGNQFMYLYTIPDHCVNGE